MSTDGHADADAEQSKEATLDALADAIDYYHDQLDRTLPAAVDDEERTVRAYIRDGRGWTDETIDAAQLGYAPADGGAGLLDYLMARGHDRDAILGTGLFYDGLTAHFRGRMVFPYHDAAGERPVYAISRSLDHPGDSMGDQKYTKAVNQKPYSRVEEPIYGVSTIRDDEPLLITEGIADAIAAHQAGYSCVSPVTTTFKLKDREALRPLLADHGVERVYIVQDAEPPGSSFPDDGEGVHDLLLPQVGEGLDGALNTAAFLADAEDVTADVRVAELPMPAAEKVDLDDYLNEWSRDDDADPLASVLAGAKPATQHPAFDPEERVERAVRAATRSMDRARGDRESTADDRDYTADSGSRSALYDLSVLDVTPADVGRTYRGPNPLGHHGESENYATIRAGGEVLADYKHPAAYNALTYLLVEAGERRAKAPFGSLDDREHLVAWRTAKEQGVLPDDDPIPTRALVHVALDAGLCAPDDVEDGWKLPREAYNDALATVREEYGLEPGREPLVGTGHGGAGTPTPAPGGHAIEECDPPDDDAEVLDVDARREELAGERFDAYLTDDAPHLWRDPQGAGKTTTATLAAATRDRPHVLFVERHKKARGHVLDDVIPDDYYHLKGSNQKRYETCMDADHDDEECLVHGDTGCPHMCPVYDLSPDHAVRTEYEHLVAEVGPEKTHELMADRLADHGHDENGMCPWRHGFKEAAKAENVVAVHEHQTLRSATHKEGGEARVPIVDEHPELGDMYGRDLGVEQLLAAARTLETPGFGGVAVARNEFARFADRLVTALTTPTDADGDADLLADVDPPNVAEHAETETVVVEDFGPETTDDDLPDGVTTADVFEATDTEREYQNPAEPQEGYREREVTRYVFERPAIREVLAEVKLAYNRRVLARMRDGDWNGEPFAFDTLLAAAAEAGLDADAARQAMALLDDLGDQTCPRCGGYLVQRNGAGVCLTDTGCGWDEATDPILAADAPQARAIASLIRRDDPADDGAGARLSSTILPHPDELPLNPLVLDATGSPVVVGATYGVDLEDVVVSGDTTPEMPNFHVTQVLDGQYHWSTLNNDDSTAFDRMMDAVEQTATFHEKVLAVGPKALAAKVADERGGFPENVDFAHYHAVKGENAYKDHDAMFALGGPPVRVDGPGGLREQARLLAQGDHAEGIEVSGVEHSTRRGTEDPIRRKLRFEDDDETGREVPTKGYTGLVGELYAIHHEREIEQAVHRIRPVNATSDTPKDAYLFTNVPTDLPVDEVVTLDELSATPAALLPVCENALALAEALADVAIDGDDGVRDGFRARSFVTRGRDGSLTFRKKQVHRFARAEVEAIPGDISLQAVNTWVNELTDLGLLDAGEYEQRRGVPYTAEIATLNGALSVITRNASFKVAQKRRLAALVANLDSAAEWLRAACGLFDLCGDRCGLGGGRPGGDGGGGHDPPPS